MATEVGRGHLRRPPVRGLHVLRHPGCKRPAHELPHVAPVGWSGSATVQSACDSEILAVYLAQKMETGTLEETAD